MKPIFFTDNYLEYKYFELCRYIALYTDIMNARLYNVSRDKRLIINPLHNTIHDLIKE